jgi:hypothetical protein
MTTKEKTELLAEARELEAEGKTALAKLLRQRAAKPRPAPAMRLVLR